jgi:hypothetical protein
MGSMPGHVARSPEFAALDAALNANPQYFFDAYKGPMTLPKLIDEAVSQGIITAATRDHIKDHWQTPWPVTNDVLKRGLYWACRLSLYESGDLALPRPTPRPIATTWICGLPAQTFEVVSLVSMHQVTVMILTPPPGHEDMPSGQGNQPVWTTQAKTAPVDPGETEVEVHGQTRTVRPQY